MEELHHQAGEALEGSRYPNSRADFNEDALGGVDINLQLPSFVDGGIE